MYPQTVGHRSTRPDAALIGPDGRVRLLVEAKARRGADAKWASSWRTYLDHDASADRAILLVTPDRLFFWSAGEDHTSALREANAKHLLSPYLSAIGAGTSVDPLVFESTVHSWLGDLLTVPLPHELIQSLGPEFEKTILGAELLREPMLSMKF